MAGTINKPKKPTSKRKTTRLRAKISKRAAEKKRKERKLARKNPEWRSKLKKDPGIPNLFPYKERLLQQIEEERIRRKEELLRKKELAKAAKTGADGDNKDDEQMQEDDEHMIREEELDLDDAMDEDGSDVDESNPLAALVRSARKAAEEYEKELQSGSEMDEDDEDDSDDASDAGSDAGVITEVHGGATSRKAYDKVFKQVVEQADVILYVLDARDPEGTRSHDVEQAVMAAAGGGKRLMLILNKVDLVPPPVLKGWLTYLRRFFPTLPLRASNPAPNARTFSHRDITVQSTSAALFRALKAYAAARNLKRAIAVGVIGYPNVGKSSVINALLSRLPGSARGGRTPCPAGAEAGVTTAIRAVKIDSKLTLLDSPGIVFPSTASSQTFIPKNPVEAHAHLVLLNAIPPKQIEDPVPAVTLLLKRLSATPELMDRLMQVYDIPPLLKDPSQGGDATMDFLVQVARKRGRLGRGGVPNIQAAAMTVVTDWRDGRIQGWTEPPKIAVEGVKEGNEGKVVRKIADQEVAPDQKIIVTEWAKEFKLAGLWGDEEQTEEGDKMEA
ncbi:putative GTP binding protein [Thermochaetoides thermophila DSM 1495]|uniref:Putative GTP binding protein n=1 Tax=Chaetomium thermophilum (strain DSM 1495 / CBS 144.50 / IMI 039719) TaxID=759272 RepID=G0SEW3_CHATD|nr:putative GTP binding protein [Thermochaetoides thermophila DSM 1495]8PV1_CL Chain CL, Putative GTP binding protein [Thermochaetoides thermophila DSM 1495]8PV2_CL Chain CL, Putative GTP binding protein [Thermochaetoides thermophila DSM 1495]8PV3_CL Chain CL, Putative GTP binding protein [Thermochaetoides thermophila DSM 1495]8PV4_CL Chain CL, Putative GTP binding protein [Thermochaetoides thermophila DSM 1495]8PV5_CL Chain CL, Putative GTP binding protein [Thermochaetoides thermophila DSM 14